MARKLKIWEDDDGIIIAEKEKFPGMPATEQRVFLTRKELAKLVKKYPVEEAA